MLQKLFAVILACVMTVCLLGGCSEATPKSGASDNLTVGIAQDLDNSLDPYQMTAAGTREVMFNVFEGLVKPDKDGQFIHAVAADHTVSEDGLTYTFPLREGVVFHNGKTCTTADVLYSFETCAATSVNGAVVAALSAVDSVTAEGNNIVVRLTAPNSDFLAIVSSVYIVPADYTAQATAPVGTGPFRFVSRSVQENVVLERHEDYYGTKAKLKQVTYKIYEDGNALFTALDSGALDLVAHLTADQCKSLSNGYTVLEGTMNLVQALYLNHNAAPFDNVLVRQALCYAVDVDEMLQLTADGHGTRVGSSMYPAFGKYFDASLGSAYPHDVDKARELLKQAGLENGFTFSITVPSNYQPHIDTATVLAQQLKEVGITAEIKLVDWSTWLEKVYQGREFESTVVGFDASLLSASSMLARWCSTSGKNMINFNNPDYDAAYALAQASTDDAQQTAAYKDCLKILSDTAANVYLQDLADFVAVKPNLKGYNFYPLYVIDLSTLYFE